MLAANMLSSAIVSLYEVMTKSGNLRFKDELTEIRNTYGMVLHYFIEGLPDAKRSEMVNNLTRRLASLNDRLNFAALSPMMSSDYFTQLRSEYVRSHSLKEIINQYYIAEQKVEQSEMAKVYSSKIYADFQEIIYLLFNKIWVTQFLDKESVDILGAELCKDSDGIEDEDRRSMMQSAIVCALYFASMEYYDPAKVKLLISCLLNNTDNKVLARAYVLLILLIARYGVQIRKDKTIISLLSLAADNDKFHDLYKTVIVNYIRCLDTARINKTIAEEIIPGLMKMRPDIEKTFKDMEKNLDKDESDINPEWEEILKKTGLEEKMRELSDLQMEGGDMFMMAFAGIKKMAFFRNPVNWLLPFNPQHTEIKGGVDRLPKEFSDLVVKSSIFCDSDCYSLFLGIKVMPDASVNLMANQIQAQVSQFNEDRNTSFDKLAQPEIEVQIGRFLKDLYRFFNQYVNASQFYNPFKAPTDFTSLPVFGDFIDNPEDLDFIGNIYFKKNLWRECVATFTKYESHFSNLMKSSEDVVDLDFYLSYQYIPTDETIESELAAVLEKKGYALMRLRRNSEALQTLLQAQYFQKPSVWVLSKIADCLRSLGDAKNYALFLDKALSLDSENKRLLLKRGRLYMETANYDDAVKIFYKLNYLNPDDLLYVRTLAWCRCLQSEAEKALNLYLSIPDNRKDNSDWLNEGHCYFAAGKYSEATKNYTEYIRRTSVKDFIAALDSDKETLPFLKNNSAALDLTRDAVLLRQSEF